ncbi:glycerol-3-phosphate O-acyltransferase 2 [Desmophyllum pertusum]|uniref:alanine transaminase n=1 Tax=Desmophyllum pertusum TaxID=174260 RepID=A0A9X0D5X5_9CNID|nr:glycerol-3-phosphate O-acyltransferase 2 [Desmophyllum pertusum]
MYLLGAYSDSQGLEGIRNNVVKYISERDGGYAADATNIYLTSGASEAIRAILKLLQTSVNTGDGRAGIMIPIPQYPLYSATLSEMNSYQINYYLDEANGWKLDIDELKRSLNEARPRCIPRALCVINPGNPTDVVLEVDIWEIVLACVDDEVRFQLENGDDVGKTLLLASLAEQMMDLLSEPPSTWRRVLLQICLKSKGMHPDSFYALELLEKTGLCVVPGNGFGQRGWHFPF